jgi:hypothetical protein
MDKKLVEELRERIRKEKIQALEARLPEPTISGLVEQLVLKSWRGRKARENAVT